MSGDDVTLGELDRRLIVLQRTIDTLSAKLESGYVRTADLLAVQRDLDEVKAGVTELRGWFGWVIKIVLGVVIAALAALVVKTGSTPLG